MDTNFYTYVHRRLDSGAIFYVGKGRDGRAFGSRCRSKQWDSIVADAGGRTVEFLMENIDEEFAFFIEREAIALFKTRGALLVNRTNGGEGISGHIHTAASRAKMSAACEGRPSWNKGRTPPAATREKMSKARMGMVFSPEHRAKLSAARIGVTLSPAARAKVSAAQKGRVFSSETRRKIGEASSKAVLCVTTGEYFKSATAAAKYFGISRQAVSTCCSGAQKTTHGKEFRFA